VRRPSAPITLGRFADTRPPRGPYRYRVRAFSPAGRYSPDSNIVEVRVR
jgi:hypothetical protein